MDISCIVLAGGKSRRMGRNKVTVTIGGKSLLEKVIERLACFKSEIIVVTAKERTLPVPIGYPRLKVVSDVYPGKGSLGGIYSGLVASATFHNLVVACDMPFLNLQFLKYLLDEAEGYDVVVPRYDGTFEPLHAVYSKGCLPHMEALLKKDDLVILDLFPMVRMKHIEKNEIDRFDPKHLSFFNVNTEADLRRAESELTRMGDKGDKC